METLGRLAAGVAHDFNNLLTGINGFVELASTTLGPGHEALALLQQARRGALSARDLVRRILNFSRNTKEQQRAPIDAVVVVRDTAPLIAAALPANVSLSLAMGCENAPLLGDAGQLQQILMNLCMNGAHAVGGAISQIRIEVSRCVLGPPDEMPAGCAPGEHVRLAVKDSGCGMDEATRQKIFEPFFTTKKAGEGTGLGLAIVQDLVSAHGGGLTLESAVGAGTTFAIFLPLRTRELSRPVVRESGPLMQGTGQRVMVVDDEPSVSAVVCMTLAKCGCVPAEFNSPEEAWQRFVAKAGAYELLIVDQNMPGLSGLELVRRVRQRAPALPVIVMSGHFEAADESALRGQVRMWSLKKPFEIVELLGIVRTALTSASR